MKHSFCAVSRYFKKIGNLVILKLNSAILTLTLIVDERCIGFTFISH